MKNSRAKTPPKKLLTDKELIDMQHRIDEGILLAQRRLVERARHNNATLIVLRNDKIVEITAEEVHIQTINL